MNWWFDCEMDQEIAARNHEIEMDRAQADQEAAAADAEAERQAAEWDAMTAAEREAIPATEEF